MIIVSSISQGCTIKKLFEKKFQEFWHYYPKVIDEKMVSL